MDPRRLTTLRQRQGLAIALLATALVAAACSGSAETVSSTTTSAAQTTITAAPPSTSAPDAVLDPIVEQNRVGSLVATELPSATLVASASWFDVVAYAGDASIDGPIVDVSDDGNLWLFGGGVETPFVLDIATRQVVHLAQGTTPAQMSGNGRYVVYSLDGECLEDESSCDLAEHERGLVDLTTGETNELGVIIGPVLANEAGTVVMGGARPNDSIDFDETIEWSGGEVTEVRMLESELEDAGEVTRTLPTLRDLDRTGTQALFTPWLETNTVGGSRYSLLTPNGTVGLAGDELRNLIEVGDADLSDDGAFVLIGTRYGLTTLDAVDGHRQNYIIEALDRDVHRFAVVGDQLLVVTLPAQRTNGPIELVSFDRNDGPFEQSARLLVAVAEALPLDPRIAGEVKLHGGADGTTAGLSLLVNDPNHPDGASWLSIIIELDTAGEESYIEVAEDGSIKEQFSEAPTSAPSEGNLAQYLAATSDIAADLVDHQLVLSKSSLDTPPLADLWRGTQARVEALSPPPSLVAAHGRWISILARFADEFEEFTSAVGSADPAENDRAADRFFATVTSLSADEAAVTQEQLDATIEALSTIKTDEAKYVAEVISIRADAGPTLQRAFEVLYQPATADADLVLRQLAEILALLDSQLQELERLDVPESAVAMHRNRDKGLRSILDTLDRIHCRLEAGFVLISESTEAGMIRLTDDAQRLNAAWSRYVATTLRG